MNRQRRQANDMPYTRVLSSLPRADLLKLCGEFRLPRDGNVVVLRTRVKDHLNLHRDDLYADPRYTGLFPRFRRANQPPPPPPSPVSSRRSSSPASSDESWHGIQEHADGEPAGAVQQQHSPAHSYHQNPQAQLNQPQDHLDQLPSFFRDQTPNFLPPVSPFLINPDLGHPSPAIHVGNGREYPSFLIAIRSRGVGVDVYVYIRLILWSRLRLWNIDTMQSFFIGTLCSPHRHYEVYPFPRDTMQSYICIRDTMKSSLFRTLCSPHRWIITTTDHEPPNLAFRCFTF